MKVSVIIPIYKMEMYLEACLDSIVNQTYKDIEIICVNDGSEDESLNILKRYAEIDNRISIISKENGGLSSARNAGLKGASGEIIYFMDSDDILVLDAITIMVTAIEKYNLDILYFSGESFFENKQLEEQFSGYKNCYTRKELLNEVVCGEELFARLQEKREFLASACLQVMKKTLLTTNNIDFYEGIIHEDELFSFRACLASKRAMCISDCLFLRRVRSNSIVTKKVTAKNFEGRFITFKESLYTAITYENDGPEIQAALASRVKQLFSSSVTAYKGLDAKEKRKVLQNQDDLTRVIFEIINYERFSVNKRDISPAVESRGSKSNDQEITRLQNEIDAVYGSTAYRIGELFLFLPKRLGGGVQCCKDHGILYTIKLAFKKIYSLKAINNFILTKILRTLYIKSKRGMQCIKDHGLFYTVRLLCKKMRNKIAGENIDKKQSIGLADVNIVDFSECISVIMPVYNTEEYLKQCIDSVLMQTYRNIELICVDDGSTDNSLGIIEEYSKQDSRVKIVKQKNLYAGMARNNGLEVANGKYVFFLDSDDFFEVDFIEKMYRSAIAHDSDIVVCKGNVYDHQKGIFTDAPWFLNLSYLNGKQVVETELISDYIFNFTNPATWNKMFKKELIDKYNISFPPYICANDLSFTLLALALSKKISVVDKVLVHYRRNISTSISAKRDREVGIFYEAYQLLQMNLIRNNLYKQYKRSFLNLVVSGFFYEYGACSSEINKDSVVQDLVNEYQYTFDVYAAKENEFYSRINYDKMKDIIKENMRYEKSEDIFLSIICDFYDSISYEETLKTLLEQTSNEYELICIIEKGTKIEEKLSGYKNVRIVYGSVASKYMIYNELINTAKGQYIQFINGNIRIKNDYVELISKLCLNKNANMYSCKINTKNSIKVFKESDIYLNFIDNSIFYFNMIYSKKYLMENHIYFKNKKYGDLYFAVSATLYAQSNTCIDSIYVEVNVIEDRVNEVEDIRAFFSVVHMIQMKLTCNGQVTQLNQEWNKLVDFICKNILNKDIMNKQIPIYEYYLAEFGR